MFSVWHLVKQNKNIIYVFLSCIFPMKILSKNYHNPEKNSMGFYKITVVLKVNEFNWNYQGDFH